MERLTAGEDTPARWAAWKWFVCGLLFLATMIMYMDRQTLAQMASRITSELRLTNEQYGQIEMAFGLAFAVGAIANGLLADRLSIRWLYPMMLIGWSAAGIATAYGVRIGEVLTGYFPSLLSLTAGDGHSSVESRQALIGFMVCRIALGYFESGHWPCALITTQRILSRQDRAFGNGLLQSGASVGLVLTPLVVWPLLSDQPMAWQRPFVVIGVVGMFWTIVWLAVIRRGDLRRHATDLDGANAPAPDDDPSAPKSVDTATPQALLFPWRRFCVLLIVVIGINVMWQFFRAWLPKMLQDQHHYSKEFVFAFTMAYYVVADLGCIGAGSAVKLLSARGWSVHRARLASFAVCSLLTSATLIAAPLPRGPALLATMLVISSGSLGLFPTYYALVQDISRKHQGLVGGTLGFAAWIASSVMQIYVGRSVDQSHSYAQALFWVGLAPAVACVALWLFWDGLGSREQAAKPAE